MTGPTVQIKGSGALRKHSLRVTGHLTSISLEDVFWDALKEAAGTQNCPVTELVAAIDRAREGNLSSAIRIYLLERALTRWPAPDRNLTI